VNMTNCKNCKSQIEDSSNFCTECGAKIIRNRLTLKNLFASFSEQFLDYDNKFLQTFINLFTRPEDVIGSYIDGTRKKYVNVVSYFAVAITIAGLQLYIINKFFPGFFDISSLATDDVSAQMNQENLDFQLEYQSLMMMIYAPIYALISRLVFLKNKKFNYTEHLVIFLYVTAQISIVSAFITVMAGLFGIGLIALTIISLPLQILYSAYCLKRLYQLNLAEIILKTLIFFMILGVVFIIAVIAMVVIMYLNGNLQEMIEAQRKAKEAANAVKGN